ncbi:PaaI family thioesterase [Novosphingobium album (ex Hu et al. 2023)]|uniref:PaaI family thioesterase n=1 Tax=Novosphingobium album (ex Hu et al. 2023) TaxID=2930093 RepID=A0ABT0B885_9SPHN|nr:PaaI family thioesterase [Novosphingobium album (ex Hu et al. 2023)]MCJ2181053.1 PaaI family thioesterase [Novosphingobium album (ex Hu et al. 2023)]
MSTHPIDLPVFASTIGIAVDRWEDGRPVLAVDYAENLCGNPGMYHGGVVATLLELAAMAALDADLRLRRSPAQLEPVNTTVEYLRPALEQRTFATARIVRAGRRLANVAAMLWQESEDKPIATATVNIEISQGSGA